MVAGLFRIPFQKLQTFGKVKQIDSQLITKIDPSVFDSKNVIIPTQ
jgi:hypothetical protein